MADTGRKWFPRRGRSAARVCICGWAPHRVSSARHAAGDGRAGPRHGPPPVTRSSSGSAGRYPGALRRSWQSGVSPLRILLVGDYPPDPRLGSPKVLFKLQEELRGLGHTCDVLFADDLGATPRNPYLRQAFAPVVALSAVSRIFRERGRYDIVDVASAEGLWIAVLRRLGGFRGTAG